MFDRVGIAALLSCLVLLGAGFAQEKSSVREARERYDQCKTREPLIMRYRGWHALLRTGETEVLPILLSDYRRPIDPKEQVQAMLASGLGRYFRDEDQWTLVRDLRLAHYNRKHYWLQYIGLELEAAHTGVEAAKKIALGERDPWLKATAIRALLNYEPAEVVPLTVELLRQKQKPGLEQSLILECLAQGFAAHDALGEAPYDAALTLLIQALDEKKLAKRTKIVIARQLGAIFNSERRMVNSEAWLVQMKRGRNREPDREQYAPSFFEIRASGDRIAYVIDMSDSMLEPLSEKFLNSQRSTTGSRRRDEKDKYDPFVDSYDIPWHKVKNRFDLAREQIKRSIYSLSDQKSFSVIGFGDRAKLLDGITGMVPANRRNVLTAVASLDGIKPGPRLGDRPHGTLWGKTNLHGGLRQAFQVRARGLADAYEGVDESAFFEGAETIFVLSDGDPTWDDWDLVSVDYKEDQYGDPESRTASTGGDNLHYSGPYRDWEYILQDVERWNLLRGVEIHCISIGNTQMNRLQALAKLGQGQVRRYGQ